MYINIERDINSNKWTLYPEATNENYLKKVISQSIACSKYQGMFNEVELSITFTDDNEIREVNKEWRGQDKPTNVISIQVEDFSDVKKHSYVFLGNIILSVDKIEEEAKEANKTFGDHCIHLIVHGILHLMGYDHHTEDESVEMESTEVKILNEFNITSPY